MPTMNQEIVKFANGNVDTINYFDRLQDWACQRFAADGRNIGSYDTSVSISEKSGKLTEAFFSTIERMSGVQKNAENAGAWAVNPSVKWAAFALIDASVNTLLPITTFPNMAAFVDFRAASYGDIVHFKVQPRDLFVVSLGGHGERTSMRQKQFKGDVIVTPTEHIVTVYVDMFSVLAGREDLGEFIRKVVIAIETQMGADAVAALNAGLADGVYPTELAYTGAFDSTHLITLAETVEAANYGARPVIMGTATALAKVLPDSTAGFRGVFEGKGGSVDIMKDFYGFDLIRMRQFVTPGTLNLALDPNTLYIVSPGADKLIKGVMTNSLTNSNQFYENADLTQNYTMRKDWAFSFVSAAYGGKYKIQE